MAALPPSPTAGCAPGAGLSLPQAQVLAELFRGRDAVLELPHSVSIFQLIALQRHFDGQPQLYAQLCQVGVRLVAVELGVRGASSACNIQKMQ